VDHFYTDFDRTDGSSGDITLSYGEYADNAPSDYGAFIARAERFVRSYDPSLDLLMREWRHEDRQSHGHALDHRRRDLSPAALSGGRLDRASSAGNAFTVAPGADRGTFDKRGSPRAP
jgi:hypothetical protein